MIARSLKSQLTVITLLPMLITLLFISALVLQEFDSKIENDVDIRAHDIAAQASMMSEFYLYSGDVDALNNVARSLLRIEDVGYIRFINNSGQLVTQRHNQLNGSPLRQYSFPILANQFSVDDFSSSTAIEHSVNIGTIELGLSTLTSQSKRYQTYQRLFFIAVAALLLGVVLVILFNRKFNKAIGSLISSAREVEQGKLNIRCDENGSGELLKFQKTFNRMARAFEQSELELKAKVETATASLLMTVQELSEKNEALAKSRQETILLERAQAISDERERIMKDMHDGIGGQLIASLALLEQEADSQLKGNIQQIISDCLNDLRMIINSLNTANDNLSALLADFKYRMNKKLDQMGISLHWHIDDLADDIRVPPQMGLNLLRILQEAFTNILKHAKATEINFHLSVDAEQLRITIKDNGHFSPSQDQKSNGMGVRNMMSRAQNLGADLHIQQADTGGCLITLSIALQHFKQH